MGCAQSVSKTRKQPPNAKAKNANSAAANNKNNKNSSNNQVANTQSDIDQNLSSGNEAHSSTTEGLSAEERRAKLRAKHAK